MAFAQPEVNNTFLNRDLFDEVCMSFPIGYSCPRVSNEEEHLVCRLNKSIYGFKQASRQRFSEFSSALLLHGFNEMKNDYSIFIRGSGASVVVLVYVVNIILACPSNDSLSQIKSHLQSYFKLKDLGVLRYFLDFEIAQFAIEISLNKLKYTSR